MKCCYKKSFIISIALVAMLLPISKSHAAALFQDNQEEVFTGTQEEYDALVAQTDAYMAAINEQDPLKRGEMLREFFTKYPKSDLIESHVKPAYLALMGECYQNEKWADLETLAEKWLEMFPNNQQTISFAATAALKLQHNDKYLKYLLVLYNMEPTAGGARAITQLYDQKGDFDNFVKWAQTCFTYPEYSVDYTLRYQILTKYADAGNTAKATEYAKKTLEVLDKAPKPDAAGQKTMLTIRYECDHIIALSYWRLGDPEKAHDYFAAAELLGGNITQQAKQHKEDLYKTLHNNTLIGIEKVHKRAQAIIDSYVKADDAQKKTELVGQLNP
jgi:tetratricopeptide (TPR) repeat protein